MTSCYKQFLSSLGKAGRVGFLAALKLLKAQTEADLVIASAKSLFTMNLLTDLKNEVASVLSNPLESVKGSFSTFNFPSFTGCSTVDAISKLAVDVVDNKSDSSGSDEYNKAKAELIQKENDNSKQMLEDRKNFLSRQSEETEIFFQELGE